MSGFLNVAQAPQNQNTQNNQNNQQNQQQNNQNQNNDNNNNNQNSNNNPNNNSDDNNSNNMDNNTSIWDNNNIDEQNNSDNNQQNNQQQETRTPTEIFDAHISDLNLTSGVDLSQMQEDAQNGNTDSLNKAFETVAANTYKAALQQVNTLMDNKITSAIDKAVSESTSVMNETTAVKEMQSALPFTSNRDIAPVAEAALKQIMSKGASINEAIQQVTTFFNSTANAVAGGNNQNDVTSGGFNPNSNVNNNNSSNNNNSNQEDSWMDFLTQ